VLTVQHAAARATGDVEVAAEEARKKRNIGTELREWKLREGAPIGPNSRYVQWLPPQHARYCGPGLSDDFLGLKINIGAEGIKSHRGQYTSV
jgi:hypothetical protein